MGIFCESKRVWVKRRVGVLAKYFVREVWASACASLMRRDFFPFGSIDIMSLPGDFVVCWVLFLSVSFFLLPTAFFFSDRIPDLVWCGSVYVVT